MTEGPEGAHPRIVPNFQAFFLPALFLKKDPGPSIGPSFLFLFSNQFNVAYVRSVHKGTEALFRLT